MSTRLPRSGLGFAFGHGLTYTAFEWSDLVVEGGRASTEGEFTFSCTVRNTGARKGTEVVQVCLHGSVASVVQPVRRLVGYVRLDLGPGRAGPGCG